MFMTDVLNSDAMPALAATMQFAAQRHELIAHNIANLDTPNYQPKDVSVSGFQKALSEAVETRRARTNDGPLPFRETRELAVTSDGRLRLRPSEVGRGVFSHDRNNRNIERSMQDLVENTNVYRLTSELLRTRFQLLDSAIRGQP